MQSSGSGCPNATSASATAGSRSPAARTERLRLSESTRLWVRAPSARILIPSAPKLALHQEAPDRATDWKGNDWTPEDGKNGVLSSHPNSRYCTPIEQCPILAPEYDDPQGVPISAILDRKSTRLN